MKPYKPIFENAVYARDKTVTMQEGDNLLLKQLILVKRYTEATEDQVVEYLKQKAGELRGAALLDVPKEARQNRSPLEQAVMQLPDRLIRDLKTGDKDCMVFVRQHTEAPAVEDGKQSRYLHVRYGSVPAKLIETNQKAGNIENAIWYDAALSDDDLQNVGLGERWNMQLLLPSGVLPNINEMGTLHGTHSSKTLEISKVRYSPDEVEEVMDFIYENFSTEKKIAQLTDISNDLLEKFALQPVIGLYKMVQQGMAAQELMQKLAEQKGGQ